MKVRNVMTKEVAACAATDTLDAVAKKLWDHDCGAVFVSEDGQGAWVGVLTDRDITMTAWMQGRPLHEITVRSALGSDLHSCRVDDDLASALELMAKHQVRRLPVRDGKKWVGVLSLADAARALDKKPRAKSASQAHVAHCLAAVCEPRATEAGDVELRPTKSAGAAKATKDAGKTIKAAAKPARKRSSKSKS